MPLTKLDHYNVRTDDLEATRAFYEGVLGLRVGPRPAFPFPGYWIYCGETAVLHLTGVERAEDAPGSGRLDHIAFNATGMAEIRARAEAAGMTVRHAKVPGRDLQQLFLPDPNGIMVELTFTISGEA